jgi:hypothetical protein
VKYIKLKPSTQHRVWHGVKGLDRDTITGATVLETYCGQSWGYREVLETTAPDRVCGECQRRTAYQYALDRGGRVTRLAGYRKYLNKSWDVDGIVFQSKHEADQYKVLRALEVAGTITDLRLQVPLHCLVNGLLVCDYIADFVPGWRMAYSMLVMQRMLADGTVLDPLTPEPKKLSDYKEVYYVAAVGRL